MSAAELARHIVEAILVRLDDHVRCYGLVSVDEEAKQAAIAVVTRMLEEDRTYF